MGVNGLWTVVQPCARPTNLATLNRKRLAVDASIWIYQFLKAVRDKEGNALRNSHVVGFFRRICKLLWFGIRPVFVFDGGAPALKRATLLGRRKRREGRREDATRTAGKLLAVQMQRLAEEEKEKRKRKAIVAGSAGERAVEEEQEQLPAMDQVVYADEMTLTSTERQKNRRFFKQDAYHLPELESGIEAMGKPEDPRIMSIEELEEYARQFNSGEDINLYDFSKIDFDGDFFKSLPPADRYNILNAARIRSRLRMGLSKDQLDDMFPDRMAFSRFQIERVQERNKLTQRLMAELGMGGTDLTMGVNMRVAGERNREYILVKNEGAEGGWALGVVSRQKDIGEIHKPIDVDAIDIQYQAKEEDDDEDEDFEDVPIEGVNRLPKLSEPERAAYQQAQNMSSARRQLYTSRRAEEVQDEDDEALFVDNTEAELFGDGNALEDDEEEDLNRAIAMSLEKQHRVSAHKADDEPEDIPAPGWVQKAVETPRPIAGTSGRTVAHIVNNRANAAVPRRRGSSDSSDSEMDLQSALAAARKKQQQQQQQAVSKPVEKKPIQPNPKNPFGGPLPFEKLDWRKLTFGKKEGEKAAVNPQMKTAGPAKPQQQEATAIREKETADFEAESDEEAGGFERESEELEVDEPPKHPDAPRPLPPWLLDDTDIRDSMRKQQELDNEMNAEDDEMREQENLLFQQQRENDIVLIHSSDDDSDVEIIEALPPKKPQAREPGASLPSLDDLVRNSGVPISTTERARSPHSEDEDEFEDVELPEQSQKVGHDEALAKAIGDAELDAELFGDGTPSAARRGSGSASPEDDLLVDEDAPGPEEFDDFSDPEEEQLLIQMAEEAQEHARFASQLNNKSTQENQEAYERELKALREQQKKDRRDADEVTQVMITECQALLRLFGIPYITAPMEAEAQCAELVHLGLVDGIVTDDSDIFLFGGTRIYKNMFNNNKFVECYLSGDLEKDLSLSRDSLISLAQLLGSDYAEGLAGVGPVTAVEILSEFSGSEGLEQFKQWWLDVQQRNRPKDADASSPFRRKFRKSQATKLFLPLGFPSPAVVEAYMQPEVDSSPEPFQWGVPDLDGLRNFLMSTIGWGQERTDEVLVPVIRDMNRRDVEGTQSNITRYFEGGVGVGAREVFAPRQKAKGSKRMADAVSRLKASKTGGSGLSTELPVMVASSTPKGPRKRKTRESVVVEDDEGDDDDNSGHDGMAGERSRNVQHGNGSAASDQTGGRGSRTAKRSKATTG
ncbi:PIN domain-like protein [Thozetella sp. PMI_491]|nr:PIN domain-like protein [Thozetella sp. PMI_491]